MPAVLGQMLALDVAIVLTIIAANRGFQADALGSLSAPVALAATILVCVIANFATQRM
jgi:hypothetical protein